MAKNIVLCCDGTSNQFGTNNTNVVRLVQVLNRDAARQRIYYDPGVGTLPEPEWHTWVREKVYIGLNLAFGFGIVQKAEAAYCYLMETWEPGDRVYLFGFSRGAYSVRVLAAMLHSLGLLPRANQNLVPYAMRLFKSIRKSPFKTQAMNDNYWKLCNQFRWTFAREVADDERRFSVHFLGVWDTVSSVGWVWNPTTFPFTANNPSIHVVRHAMAIDERRWFFRQNEVYEQDGEDFKQIWSPGSHCDIGGGYPEESGLWRVAFEWMIDESQKAGLLVDAARLTHVLRHSPPPEEPWREPVHESLTTPWWPLELVPKWTRLKDGTHSIRCGHWGHRYIAKGQLISPAALLRLRDKTLNYRPKSLSSAFVQKVQGLSTVTDPLPYAP